MVTLAALELQSHLQKISGAKLPIVTEPAQAESRRIYLGKSPWTEKLGVSAEGLKYGAYRFTSGPDWVAVVGGDFDFVPPFEPWPRRRSEVQRGKEAWSAMIKEKVGADWAFPFHADYKGFWSPKNFAEQMQARYGEDFARLWKTKEGEAAGFWNQDEGGTLNGVYAILHELGVRWYMPGKMGEVLPQTATVAIPAPGEPSEPAFAFRSWNWYQYWDHSFEDVIWARRLRMNSAYEKLGLLSGPHGLHLIHQGAEMKKEHPEYYALRNGKRDIEHRDHGTPCFSSEGFYQETVRWIRFMFDELKFPSVDIWPGDGLAPCQCADCTGKPLNELVWTFVDRVGRELYKTHPEKMITSSAYANYKEAPASVEKFTPNIGVFISNRGRPAFDDPDRWSEYQNEMAVWSAKVPSKSIIRNENNRYSLNIAGPDASIIKDRDALISFPVIQPRTMAKDLQYLKGRSIGEQGEISLVGPRFRFIGIDHLTLYVQGRCMWDPDQDLEALLAEYYEKFYGPAAAPMREALTFAEKNYARADRSRPGGKSDPSNVPLETSLKFRELLEVARKAAGETVYGQRIAKIQSELLPADVLTQRVRAKEEALATARAKGRKAEGVAGVPLAEATGHELQCKFSTPAGQRTSVKFGWDRDALLVEIRAGEPDMAGLQVTDTVWDGDHVALALETPDHSYYKIEVNPAGKVAEGNPSSRWKSLATVETERGADFWKVRLRIPVVGREEGQSDPMHRVVGSKPTAASPWFINVARKRTRDGKEEVHAFSRSGNATFYEPVTFGRLEFK